MNRSASMLLAVLAVLTAAVMAGRGPALANSIQDDGFIYFRIAENAAAGHGPVFNRGERVDAATSPVWLWILTATTWARVPPHLAAAALGLLATMLAILGCGRWALELATEAPPRPETRVDPDPDTNADTNSDAIAKASAATHAGSGVTEPSGVRAIGFAVLALTGAVALAVDDRILLYAFSGMETLLCSAAWLWASRALVRRWVLARSAPGAGWWALAAALVRPEFVLLALGIAAAALVRSKARAAVARTIASTLLPAILGGAAYLVAHQMYFGDPLPNTYYAKRASDWEHARIGIDYVVGFVRAYPWIALVPIAFASLAFRPVVAAVGTGLLFLVVHVVRLGGDHFEFHRAFIHVLPICAAVAGAGAARLSREGLAASAARRVQALQPIGCVAAVATMIFLSSRTHVTGDAFQWVQLAARLGTVLSETYAPDTRVGLFALGATGYTSRLPVVDALGIADEYVARQDLSHEHVCHLDIGHERGDPAYLLDKTDVVVLFAAYAPVEFETLEEVREGFYSHKKFIQAAKDAIQRGQFVLRNIEFLPGVHWAVLERTRR